jgi:hypothetical protein
MATRKFRPPKPPKAPPVKALIGRTEGNHDYGGPGYFVCELSPLIARVVITRWLLWRQAYEQDKQLYELQFWDYHVVWLNDVMNSSEELPEELRELIDEESDECLTLPYEEVRKYVDAEGYHARTACEQMCVGDNDVRWTCYQKHGDGEYSTGQTPLAAFLVALAEQELPGDPIVTAFAAGSHNADECYMFLDHLKERGVLT